MSIGVVREPESCQEKDAWINDNDRAYGTMCLDIPPNMCYLLDSVYYPFDICRNLDEALGMHQEYVSYMESKQMGTSLCALPPMISASYISQEAIRNEEEELAIDSTNDPTQLASYVASSPCQELPSLMLKIYLSIIHPSPLFLMLRMGKMYF